MSDEGEVEVVEGEVIEDEPAVESAGDDVKALASAVAAKATEEAFIEIPVMADEDAAKDDEKTEDQMTEIEEDKQNMGARQTSLDEFRDIPMDTNEPPTSQTEEEEIVEASVVESIDAEAAAKEPEPEPPAKEATPTKEASPPKESTRKKVTIEESPPASPVRKEGSASPDRKEPSWWKKSKKPEEETIEAESVEEQKSKSEEQPPPAPEPEPEPEPEPAPAEPEPKPEKVAEPELEPAPVEEAKEEAPKTEEPEFIEVPVTAEEPPAEEEASKVELVPAEEAKPEPREEKKPEPAREDASPPRERVSRRDRTDQEERPARAAPIESTYSTPMPIIRTPTYVTYSSWAPASDYRSTYIPTYSSYVRPSSYYQPEYSTTYSRPTSQYVRNFDNYVRTGAFGQGSYATDRLRSRSRSRERSGFSYAGYYTPPPLRRNREYSLPSRYSQSSGPPSAAPSRSGSFVNFMDYVVTTDRNLRRSASRTSSITSMDAYAPLSRTASRTILPTPADTINHYYTKQIAHVNNYVSRLNQVYDNNVYGYSSRYNTSRPYTGYLTSGLGEYSTYSRSLRGHASDLERRLSTHKTYLRAYDLTRLTRQTAMTRSVFW